MTNDKIIIHEQNCVGCLICQLICSFSHNNIFNPSKSYILIKNKDYVNKITFTAKCNNCGLCVKHCLYGALERRDG